MKMTSKEFFEAIKRKETPEEYKKRKQKLRKLCNKRDELEDMISVLADDTEPKLVDKRTKAEMMLKRVEEEIKELK